ncbi:MAG: dCTP deaminase, partial [Alphaproteobacteria bacterium]
MSILPSQHLEDALKQGFIKANIPIPSENIQPASIDLRLGDIAWRIAASFLPSSQESVLDKIK